MPSREEVLEFLNEELDLEHFRDIEDAKFNGALVKGSEKVEKVALCTNTTFENIESAEDLGADLVIVHHGGWEQFDQDLLEKKKEQIREANITWYIAHETMDCKEEYGISATLAKKLGIELEEYYGEHAGGKVGVIGSLEVESKEFFEKLEAIEPGYETVGELKDIEDSRIAVVGGSGGVFTSLIQESSDKGCDFFITGNSSFAGDIYAHEKGITMVKLEETSSERWGVYALGERLKEEFSDIEKVKIAERNW